MVQPIAGHIWTFGITNLLRSHLFGLWQETQEFPHETLRKHGDNMHIQ